MTREQSDADFSAFYRQHYKRLVTAMSTYIPRAEAEDVAQEAFVRAYAAWPRVVAHPHPDGWLFVTAFRLVRRSRVRQRELPAGPLADSPTLETVEDRLHARTLLDRATYRQRAAIVLRFYYELSVSEVASLLRCREGTVKSLVSRGISAMTEAQETRL